MSVLDNIRTRLAAAAALRPIRLDDQTPKQRAAADEAVRLARVDTVLDAKVDLLQFCVEHGLSYPDLLARFGLLPKDGE